MGEASSKISESFKNQHPDIEWKLIKLMRNKLIHEYFGISNSTIYNTIQQDLSPLLAKLKAILN